jgi:exopolysaccharide biosynthesis polyprenyl glycosylphosphotransferase
MRTIDFIAALLTLAAVAVATGVWTATGPQVAGAEMLLLLGAMPLLWQILCAAMGVYDPTVDRTPRSLRWRVLGSALLGSMATLALPLSAPSEEASFIPFFVYWPAVAVATLLVRGLARRFGDLRRTLTPREVIIIGSGPRAQRLFADIERDRTCGYRVLGFVDTNSRIDEPEIKHRLLGGLEQLEQILMRRAADEVLIALPIRSQYRAIERVIGICERVGVESKYLADIFGNSIARPRYSPAGGVPIVALKVVTDDARLGVKRLIDIVGAALGLLLFAPALLAIALAVRLTSPGPVFFVQERYGLNRRIFRMYKFRTMVEDAEARQADLEHINELDGPVFKIRRDPRITRIGGFLRRTSLDELPQLFNVFSGEMSMVGPRPMATRDVHRFSESWLMRRFSVKPGLTCLWQVSGRNNLDFDEWMRLDLKYIDSWSLGLELRILLKTVPAVLRGTGAM